MSTIPEELKYTDSHEWVQTQDDGSLRIGITDFAQTSLGDVVYVELPEPGTVYTAGSECAVVESVKSASDLYCPVNGQISAVNQALDEEPERLNSDPYGEGWIYCVKPDDLSELDSLLTAEGYGELTAGED